MRTTSYSIWAVTFVYLTFSGAALAHPGHPGHGADGGSFALTHLLSEPLHGLSGLAIVGGVIGGSFLAVQLYLRTRRRPRDIRQRID